LPSVRAAPVRLGTERVVVVQPSVYGYDNRCTLSALEYLGSDRCRGVAVIDPEIDDDELQRLHQAGVRGARVNLFMGGAAALDRMKLTATRIVGLGWHTQIHARAEHLPELLPASSVLPTRVVMDHMAQISARHAFDDPAVCALRTLLATGRAWVKLCAYRSSLSGYPFLDADAVAELLLAERPDRCVWGTDWPHPAFAGTMPDDVELLEAVARWTANLDLQRRLLVDNPATLYGF
jgi:D-galactarolactone isomerase